MSGLTKKAVFADKVLSTVLGVKEGDFVSYAEISRGLHKYIKENNLRSDKGGQATSAGSPIIETESPREPQSAPVVSATKNCRDCGVEIPSEALFCDLCGISQ